MTVIARFSLLCGILSAGSGSSVVAQSVQPIRELVIGSDADIPLTVVGPVAVLDDSIVVVSQPLESHLKVFDRSGRLIRDIGRAGGGPGEFRFLNQLGVTSDGNFWVFDGGHQRISVFESDGSLRETVTATGAGLSRILLLLPGDTVVVLRRSPVKGAEIVAIAARDGGLGRHWMDYRITSRPSLRYDLPGFNRQASGFNPFGDHPIVEGASDGSAVVHITRQVATAASPAQFAMTVLRSNGSRLERKVSYRPIPVDDEDISRAVHAVADRPRTIPGSPQGRVPLAALTAEIREAMWVPDWHAPVTGALISSDGRVWVRREDAGDEVRWEVYSADLTRVDAVFSLPSASRAQAVEDDHIWVVETGAYDEPLLVRYRVPMLPVRR